MAEQHHYVTRAYLAGFLADREERLYVYTRNHPHFFRGRPEKVARIHNYYSQERDDGTVDDNLEHILQRNVEDPGLAIIRKLNSGKYSISGEARAQLALLLAIQEYRVPWMRQHTEELVNIMQKKYSEVTMDTPGLLERHLEEVDKDRAPGERRVSADELRHALRSGEIYIASHPTHSLWAMAQAAEILTNVYYGMQWTVLEGQNVPFLASDCPVHRYFLPIDPHIPFRGLMDMRVQVRFPLSRSTMLVLMPDAKRLYRVQELLEMGKKDAAAKLQNANSQIHSIRVTDDDVRKINAHTISMAARIVLSPKEMPEITDLFRGECQNVRNEIHNTGDLLMVTAEYGQTAKKSPQERQYGRQSKSS